MKLIIAYQTKNDCYKKGQKITPKGIVWHSTGANNPNLSRYVDCQEIGANKYGNHWNRPGVSKMVHCFIGKAKTGKVEVVNTLPFNFAAWGVGKGKKGSYNYNPAHIQFEVCEDGLSDRAYFDATYQAGVELCAHLCKTYNLSPDSICSHKEAANRGYASNHADPEHWFAKFGKTMDDVRKDVANLLEHDVDGDGKITTADARLALQMAVGKIKNAGKYTVSLARKILRKAVGKE